MDSEDFVQFLDGFAVFNPIGESAKDERLDAGHSFIAGVAVGKCSWDGRDFGNPSAIFLAVDFNNHRVSRG